jgi:hypothetical protein
MPETVSFSTTLMRDKSDTKAFRRIGFIADTKDFN